MGKGEALQIFEDDNVAPYLEGLDQEERRGGGASRAEEAAEGGADEDGGDQPPAPAAQVSHTQDWAKLCPSFWIALSPKFLIFIAIAFIFLPQSALCCDCVRCY